MEKENLQKTLMTHHFETSVRMLRPQSVQINCQHCCSYVRTITKSNINQKYLVGWCICCIGLCKKEFKGITHICPNCGKVIGTNNGFDLV